MDTFRSFEAGTDPFDRVWSAQFKYLQTGISIRHSDSVDVCFVLESGSERLKKIVVIQNADIRAYAKKTGRPVNDGWCARIAMCKIKRTVETAEDAEKEYLAVPARELEEFDAAIKKWETNWVAKPAA